MPVTRSKRKASEKQPIETQGDLPSSHKAPRSRRSQKTPNAPVPEEIGQKGAALTRRRAQALGEQPTSARDEPERYLQQQARQQARTASKNDAEEMERRQSGGPPRVSLFLTALRVLYVSLTNLTLTHCVCRVAVMMMTAGKSTFLSLM